ncbi:hypothetical protein H4582DRAFT_1538053 [Lactarius indigo]|nr:hypothetical protein H4582DRAFT_1538053 [Lactarius indigo]
MIPLVMYISQAQKWDNDRTSFLLASSHPRCLLLLLELAARSQCLLKDIPTTSQRDWLRYQWIFEHLSVVPLSLQASLFRRWAHRYLHTVRRSHIPHVRGHIQEYFSRGVPKFRIFGLVRTSPLLVSVFSFFKFTGLAFSFRANHTVEHFTLAIVGFCFPSHFPSL